MIFLMERETVSNNIALGIAGREMNKIGMSMKGFIDADTLEFIAEDTWRKLWNNFSTFGTARAGIIELCMLGRLFKLLVDTVINGYAIYSLYGFSIHLIGSVWNSVTQLLLYREKKKKRNKKKQPQRQKPILKRNENRPTQENN